MGRMLRALQVPTGRFKMVGVYDSMTRVLLLHPHEWVAQPPGYFTVGISESRRTSTSSGA